MTSKLMIFTVKCLAVFVFNELIIALVDFDPHCYSSPGGWTEAVNWKHWVRVQAEVELEDINTY